MLPESARPPRITYRGFVNANRLPAQLTFVAQLTNYPHKNTVFTSLPALVGGQKGIYQQCPLYH
jgi:hypothetical protein